jgi:hypothetical protein
VTADKKYQVSSPQFLSPALSSCLQLPVPVSSPLGSCVPVPYDLITSLTQAFVAAR